MSSTGNDKPKRQADFGNKSLTRKQQTNSGSKELNGSQFSDIELDVIDVDADFVETSVVFKQNRTSLSKQSQLSQQKDGSMKYKTKPALCKKLGAAHSKGKKGLKGGKIDNYFEKSPLKKPLKRKSWEMEEVVVSSDEEDKKSRSPNVSLKIAKDDRYMGIDVQHSGNSSEKDKNDLSAGQLSDYCNDIRVSPKSLETAVVDVVIENRDELDELFKNSNESSPADAKEKEEDSCDKSYSLTCLPRRSLHAEFKDAEESNNLNELVEKSCNLLFQTDEQSKESELNDDCIGDGGFIIDDETDDEDKLPTDEGQNISDTESTTIKDAEHIDYLQNRNISHSSNNVESNVNICRK